MSVSSNSTINPLYYSLVKYSTEYSEFDPLLKSPTPRNPWITNDETLWTLERSLLVYTHLFVHMWVYIHVSIYVCMYNYVYTCMYVCITVYIHVCTHV